MSRNADPTRVVLAAGGICDAATLRAACSARGIRRALDAGEIVSLRRGRYGVKGITDADRLSVELTATVTGLSAALAWGWEVKRPPALPDLTLLRGRKVTAEQRRRATLHWWDRRPDDVVTDARGVQVTGRLSTVTTCLRTLPFDEALCVADSALRGGMRRADVVAALERGPRTGRTAALRVAGLADRRAANPFESCLRAVCLDVRGLTVRPQVQIGPYRVDLADVGLRIVVEADSRTWHAGPDEHDADIRRYTTLVRQGWVVVRFSYSDVMDEPGYVAAVLRDVVAMAAAGRRAA
ncbi:very-short-patch-repair endonuclease [Nocardioides aromaticivorans]|uniref:Very-short-patch-repair endonuclease n=1 Tax=Nocardioides aromaticivorans TaxID=200618 RepID=A0A7Y9ZFS7_9ACTN|nr:DUF559 domain-containing protein [Nocardioides aromaticivorans]NYI44045.1 very-short-patch-repair endonuclease [Nocardioides aromaticivorans]